MTCFFRSLRDALVAIAFCVSLYSGSLHAGVPITYRLPADGSLPRDYLVTLAIVDAKNTDWIVSTFVAGAHRTVTADNAGRFTETWDGLDDNFMPVPPGDYKVKGIYLPAAKWPVDGEWHGITPLFSGGASPWLPSPTELTKPVPFGGDPVNAPLKDIAVGPNGVAVFYYQYLENGTNCPMFDLNKPIGYDQFLRAFNSGGAGGGPCIATDGETVWAFSTDGGPKFLYRADQKSFGESPGANRRNGYLPQGWVQSMATSHDPATKKQYVFAAQRGKIEQQKQTGSSYHSSYHESETEFVDMITVHDGADGKVVASLKLERPQGLAVRDNRLYALHRHRAEFVVSSIGLKSGLPDGAWQPAFTVPKEIAPFDLEVDPSSRFYLSDPTANKAYQLDAAGKVTRTFGRLAMQQPGTYDRETLMNPEKLATWRDAAGKDRLLIVEAAGPNRVSEWSADDGTLLREFPSYQTKCNNGYAIDPADASLVYLPGHREWLTRFKIDPTTKAWQIDAVWPNVVAGQRQGLDKPVAVRVGERLYLASEQNTSIYRLAGEKWLKSAGIVLREQLKEKKAFFWNDSNGNGEVAEAELRPTTLPPGVLTYHGARWLADLSYIAPGQGSRDVWRLAPAEFDEHGNPVFREFQKLFTDPILQARADGKASALYGGNELADRFPSDWMQADGTMTDGFYLQARGHNFNANEGGQHKISRYVPDGAGGYKLKWRVGRSVLGGKGKPGEIYGGMRLFKPIAGLLTVVDQSRSGLLLYTDDGMYVDTLFPSSDKKDVGVYQQPGEFFAGTIFSESASGKIYYGSGKYTPLVYEMQNWTTTKNPTARITTLQDTVSISASQIASPPEVALSIRGGAGAAKIARFAPALGGAALDGSLVGWESAEPITYAAGKEQTVEVRALYDPEHLYVRWHVRLGAKFQAKPLPPAERLFTHDQASDTVGLYIQGDVNAPPATKPEGRPGDVRFVVGLFEKGGKIESASLALYPAWNGSNANPQTYRTPVGEAKFAHAAPIAGAKIGHAVDADEKGFVIAAEIPRSAIPALTKSLDQRTRTLVNFDANLGGHNKFWWANSDGSASRETYDEPSEARLYPGSWAPAELIGIDDGVVVRNWQTLGPFGGPGTEKFADDPRTGKEEIMKYFEAAKYPPDDGKLDFAATYTGSQTEGWWKPQGPIRWKPASIAPVDTRVIVGRGSQVWYGATWIYAPTATDVEFEFQNHRMTKLRWQLNEVVLDVPDKSYQDTSTTLRTTRKTVSLKAGWNQIDYRAYCVGYPPFRVGLVVKAPAATLWGLKFAATPPERESR